MEHPPCSHDLTPNGFWLFPKINCIKGTKISWYWRHPKKCDNTESYSTIGFPKNVSNSGSIVGLSA
jgi:hypothetical protein